MWHRFAYAMPSFTIVAVVLIHQVFIIPYYELLGASIAALSFYTALARSLDAVLDVSIAVRCARIARCNHCVHSVSFVRVVRWQRTR